MKEETDQDLLIDSAHPALLELEQLCDLIPGPQRVLLERWRERWVQNIHGSKVVSMNRLNKDGAPDRVRETMNRDLFLIYGEQAARLSGTIRESEMYGVDGFGAIERDISLLVIRREPE